MNTINIVWVSQINRKHEPMPEAALVSSEGKWCSWTFTDYTMGISRPHFPVPATIRVSWLLSLDYRPVVIHRDGNIEYAVTDWI